VPCSPDEDEDVEVDYAADLSTRSFPSFFKPGGDAHFDYEQSSFNLKNIVRDPASLTLEAMSERKIVVSGVTWPWLYVGMKFASFCWHVEDLYMHSVNYNHQGAVKTWYVVPGSHREQFEQMVQDKCRAELGGTGTDYLKKITLLVSPLEVLAFDIPLYKAHQAERTFVVTFPQAYHAGFSHGFNVCEAVNFIPRSALPHLLLASSNYRRTRRVSVFPVDWLLLTNPRAPECQAPLEARLK
jgi:histone demethylase JARID1